MSEHAFDPGYTGMSRDCNALVIRDGAGDDCGLPREAHEPESILAARVGSADTQAAAIQRVRKLADQWAANDGWKARDFAERSHARALRAALSDAEGDRDE